MKILEEIKEQDVTDFDFMFTGGSKLSVMVNRSAGDTVTEAPDRYTFWIAAKPDPLDLENSVESESMEVFKTHLIFLSKRDRKIRLPTLEEKANMQKFIHDLAKKVQ